ncbi:MAG: hypothetical protein M1399_09685 [Actinobacteria bacterium]|nr:hypothetical protein [Actinomycetota bacterium]MCL5447388.1 hypothetical protein [Actinomycetota bacterium]
MSPKDVSGVPLTPPVSSASSGAAPVMSGSAGSVHGAHVRAGTEHDQPGKVSLEDIEGKLRSMTTRAGLGVEDTRQRASRYGVPAAGALVVVAYLIGKRRGRLKSAVIEIKRG